MIKLLGGAAALALLAFAGTAQAGVTLVNDNATFDALGTIDQTTNFDGYDPNGFTSLGATTTFGALTFTTGDNLIVGTGTGFHPIRNTFNFNNWSPVSGTIASDFTLFGFKLGTLGTQSAMSITLYTNLGSYSFADLSSPMADSALDFHGFVATGGEHFTGFTLSSAVGGGSAPSTTDFELGHAGAVPEPASWAMMVGGFGLAGAAMRRRRTAIRFA